VIDEKEFPEGAPILAPGDFGIPLGPFLFSAL
jgi:hypothetical protein